MQTRHSDSKKSKWLILAKRYAVAYLVAITSITALVTGLAALGNTHKNERDTEQTQAIAKSARKSAIQGQTAIYTNCVTSNGLRRRVYGYFSEQIDMVKNPSPVTLAIIQEFNISAALLADANEQRLVTLRAVRDKFQPVPCRQKYNDFNSEVLNG